MYFTTNDQCTLYYEIYGEGTPLLLLHGNGEDSSYFKHQIAYFQTFYKVITIDMRGHGKSGYNHVMLNFDLFAQDVIALMNHLSIKQAHILGFSDGGNTAITIALSYPNRVLSLIANGADLHPSGVKKRYQVPICIGYAIRCMFPKKYVLQKQQIMDLMVHHPNIDKAQLACISCPTLVIVGNKDMIKQSHSEDIAAHIKHAQLRVIKGTHFIARDHSEEFNQIIDAFLKTVS